MWGTHWAGGILSPANPAYTVEELAHQLKDCGARAVVTQKQLLGKVLEACKKVGIEEEMIVLMGDERDTTAKFKHFTNICNISGTSRYRKTKVDANKDLAFLVYSSGTTGYPKGVMLSHKNIVSNTMQLRVAEGGNLSWKGGKNSQGDKILAFLPFFHIYVCPSYLNFEPILIHIGPYMPNPPSPRYWPHLGCHVLLLPGQILPNHPRLRHNVLLCCPSRNPAARKIPHCVKLRPFFYPDAEQWCSAPH